LGGGQVNNDSSVEIDKDGDPESTSLKATESYVEVAERKANLFLELSLFEMYKHSDRWANHLVFCGVTSEKQTARCVAKFLIETIPRQSIAEETSTVTKQPSFWDREPDEVGDVYIPKCTAGSSTWLNFEDS
jgi:hypothetical protein